MYAGVPIEVPTCVSVPPGAFVRDALGQCVQAQEENAEADHCDSKGDRHDDHEHIGLARCGNKKGQMFGRSGMRRLSRRGIGGEARRRS